MSVLPRLAARAYPPWFRSRYGPEFAALVEDVPASARATADTFAGAARAWVRGPGLTADSRLRASASTTWVAWCAGFLVAPAVNRALLDPVRPGVSPAVRLLTDAAYVLFFLGWALALVGVAPIGWRAVRPAVRDRQWRALRPLAPVAGLGVVEAGGLLALANSHGATASAQPSPAVVGLGVGWLIGALAFVVCLGVGPAMTLNRLRANRVILRNPALVAAPLALTLAGLTACSVAAVALSGHAALLGRGWPVAVALAVAGMASAVALISSARGVHAVLAAGR
jgi:hypothetical protein